MDKRQNLQPIFVKIDPVVSLPVGIQLIEDYEVTGVYVAPGRWLDGAAGWNYLAGIRVWRDMVIARNKVEYGAGTYKPRGNPAYTQPADIEGYIPWTGKLTMFIEIYAATGLPAGAAATLEFTVLPVYEC